MRRAAGGDEEGERMSFQVGKRVLYRICGHGRCTEIWSDGSVWVAFDGHKGWQMRLQPCELQRVGLAPPIDRWLDTWGER